MARFIFPRMPLRRAAERAHRRAVGAATDAGGDASSASDPAVLSSRRRARGLPRRVVSVGAVVAVVVSALLLVATRVTLPYYALVPGDAVAVAPLISIDHRSARSLASSMKGSVLLTDVGVEPVRLIDLVPDWLSSSTSLVRTDELTGGVPTGEFDQEGVVDMAESQLTAEAVAFRQVGVPVVEHDVGAVVYVVLTRSPAWGHVQVGDVVRAVDATSVTNASGLVAAIRSHRPGDVVTLTLGSVTDPAKSHEVRVRLGADPERPGVGFLGVIAFTQPSYGLPERVSIFDDGIGGPSAGLAFTLGLIDDLVGGDLTGGKVVAATGTIRPDGTVGAVGGVPQKTVAVARAGASVFLVPASEAPSAKRVAPRTLRVVPVDDLRQALAVLASLGGHLGAAASGPPPGPGGHSAPAGWQDAPWY